MAFKRGTFYRLKFRGLPGYGAFAELHTYTASKRTALEMERLVLEIANRGLSDSKWYKILDALRPGERGARAVITLPDVLRAHHENRLESILSHLEDPLLVDAIFELSEVTDNIDTLSGLRSLAAYAEHRFGSNARLSVLRIPSNITRLCFDALSTGGRSGKGMKRNSIRRTVLLATSKLLKYHFGKREAKLIMDEVDFPGEDDSRDVWLNPQECKLLLSHCEPWFRPFVLSAILLGADRKPLINLRVRDVQIFKEGDQYAGTVYLRDTKNDARPRTVAVAPVLALVLSRLMMDKDPDDPVFHQAGVEDFEPLTPGVVTYWFKRARKAADMEHVRLKDLRHTFAVTADRAGVSIGQMKAAMGHTQSKTTLRYLKRSEEMTPDVAQRIAAELGLGQK